MHLSADQLQQMLPTNRNIVQWHELAHELFPRYQIDTVERIAGFVANTAHESLDWTIIEENLNYSAAALNRVFGKYFRHAGVDPRGYHRQPERIANRVYANRMDNGNESSGDGWRYRGRGLIQLTGKYNYKRFSDYIGIEMDRIVNYLSTPVGALDSACWFWYTNGLNEIADRQDIRGMTRRINGGLNGLDDRKRRYRDALDILDGDNENFQIDNNLVLRIGSRGETVRMIQSRLNLVEDGVFGPVTQSAVMNFQIQLKLKVDGIVGPNTLRALMA